MYFLELCPLSQAVFLLAPPRELDYSLKEDVHLRSKLLFFLLTFLMLNIFHKFFLNSKHHPQFIIFIAIDSHCSTLLLKI